MHGNVHLRVVEAIYDVHGPDRYVIDNAHGNGELSPGHGNTAGEVQVIRSVVVYHLSVYVVRDEYVPGLVPYIETVVQVKAAAGNVDLPVPVSVHVQGHGLLRDNETVEGVPYLQPFDQDIVRGPDLYQEGISGGGISLGEVLYEYRFIVIGDLGILLYRLVPVE